MKEVKFNEAIEEYLIYIKLKLKLSTFKTNERLIKKYILYYFENKNIYDITNKDYLKWQIYINSLGFSFNYKSSIHYCFTTFLDYCINFYDLKNNVAKNVGGFRNDMIKKEGNILTIEEFERFINVVDNKKYNVLFKTLYFTGLRVGECLALTFNDIDFNSGIIRINKTLTRYKDKNGNSIITTPKTSSSNRIIYIDDLLKNELKELYDIYKLKYEYLNCNSFIFGIIKPISFTQLKRKKDFYFDKANLKPITIHQFRHSHAVLLYTNKVPIEDIKDRLGHSNISMTMDTYLKYIPTQEKRVINTLNSIRLNF